MDWRHLAVAVLDGDAQTMMVFADLLEEAGDLRRARWLRDTRKGVRNRLEFVLGILPPDTAALLACDFAEHGLASNASRTLQSIAEIRRCVLEPVATEEVDQALEAFRGLAADFAKREEWEAEAASQCLATLALAADYAYQARGLQMEGGGRAGEGSAKRTRARVRRVADLARRVRVQMAWQAEVGRWVAGQQRDGYTHQFPTNVRAAANQAELTWQVEATREVLAESPSEPS